MLTGEKRGAALGKPQDFFLIEFAKIIVYEWIRPISRRKLQKIRARLITQVPYDDLIPQGKDGIGCCVLQTAVKNLLGLGAIAHQQEARALAQIAGGVIRP
ncbi:MAG TPA: hypothetical protein VLZ12_10230 [Verrucomicrobiae bacterium]|nr:hypothetical protein [Verrucomicrobiae bacterium]